MGISLIKNKKNKDVISGMFLSAAIAMIITQVVGVVANLIDGIVTSNFYGTDAYSAISLFAPIINTIVMVAGFISTGCQIVCSQKLGKGENEEANKVFALAVRMGIVISLAFVVFSLLFPDFIFSICGITVSKYPEIYPYMKDYLNGYVWGIPAVIFVQILSPIVVLDNDKKLVTFSAVVLCVADIIGDVISATVFNAGNFGMGIATTIAFYMELAMLLYHFAKKNANFRLFTRKCNFSDNWAIFKTGSPTLIRKLATVLRDLFINRLNLVVALSTVAVAARSIQNDLNTFMFTIGLGIGRVLVTMTSMYYSAEDKEAIRRLFTYSMKVAVGISSCVGILIFCFAKPIVYIFSSDPEIMDFAVFSIRCMAVSLVFDTVAVSLQNYLQGIQNLKMVNFMNFAERFFIPIATAGVMGFLWGSKGILASIAVGKVVLVLMIIAVICIRNKRFPKCVEDFMFLPDGFGGHSEDNFYYKIFSREDVVDSMAKVQEYGRARNISADKINKIVLFIEELGLNAIKYGKPNGRTGLCVELRVYISDKSENITITLRDYCAAFDPTKYHEQYKNDADEKHLGIMMVMHSAKDIRYTNAFNSNNVLITI